MTVHDVVDPDLAQPLAVAASPSQYFAQGADGGEWDGFVDYFGFDEREKWYFPDGKQWIEFKKLDEGARARFLKATRSDLHMNQRTQEARIQLDQSKERKELLLQSCTNWFVVRRVPNKDGGVSFIEQPFNNAGQGSAFGQWIDKANPAILALLEKAIRKANPWLLNEMTLEQIDKEIADLNELRATVAEREAKEKSFSNAG